MTNVAEETPTRAVLFFHRPLDDPYTGSSRHCRGFLRGLERFFPIRFVGPDFVPPSPTVRRDRGHARLAVVGYLIQATWRAVRFVVEDAVRGSSHRARVLIAFDVYLAGIVAVWARIRQVDLVYYPQDIGGSVTEGWLRSGIPGTSLLRAFRLLPERLARGSARLVLVPSTTVRDAYRAQGVDTNRLRICTLKRDVPTYSPEAALGWDRRLALNGAVAAVFVGSFQYPPNVRAFEYLRSTLAPELRGRGSTIRILVAGLDSEPFARDLPDNVRVLGTVDDLDGLLFASSVGLAPMEVSGGTSAKIIDYLLHGLPTVATPDAARGVAESPGLHIAPLSEFADTVLEVARAAAVDRWARHPPEPDSRYIELYTRSEDLEQVAQDLRDRNGLREGTGAGPR